MASTATKNKYQEFFPGKQANETAGSPKPTALFFFAPITMIVSTRAVNARISPAGRRPLAAEQAVGAACFGLKRADFDFSD